MAASNATNPSLMRTRKLTGLAIFTAVIVVLQILCTFVRFGPFSITLALTPIVIGAAVYGAGSGAFLGFVMGLVVLITGILGWDGGTVNYLISINAFSTILLCMLKSIVAGWANTGLFILLLSLFFRSTLEVWAGGTSVMHYTIISLTGINFLIELLVNLGLASVITRIIKSGVKKLRLEK